MRRKNKDKRGEKSNSQAVAAQLKRGAKSKMDGEINHR